MALFLIIMGPFAGAFLSLVIKKKTGLLGMLAVTLSSLSFIGSLIGAQAVLSAGTYSIGTLFSIDSLSVLILCSTSFLGVIVTWYSIGYLHEKVIQNLITANRIREYFALLHLFLLAMYIALITTSPIIMWIAIETTTLSTIFLINFYRNQRDLEASWKYLIINSIGLLLAFFGTVLFLTAALQGEAVVTWNSILSNASHLNPFIAKIAFVFILIGYGTKIGLVPMHAWKPEVYNIAPSPIVALLSSALVNVAFFAIIRFKEVSEIPLGSLLSGQLLIFFGIITLVFSAFSIFVQKDYKRLFAYSSIEHAGIMALGFGFGGLGVFAALLHMLYHSIAKSIIFLGVSVMNLKYNSTKIAGISGTITVIPVTSVIFFAGFLALAGMPPFGMFFSEFYILRAGIAAHPYIVAVALFSLTLAFVGFLQHLTPTIFGKAPEHVKPGERKVFTAPLIVLAVVLLVLSIYLPQALMTLLERASLMH